MLEALSEPEVVVADSVHQACYHQKKQASWKAQLVFVICEF